MKSTLDRTQGLQVDLIRGGTSKGVFINRGDLPEDLAECEPILLDLMGSPDPRQINGLGGAVAVTSKVALIQPSVEAGVDIDYLFAQVDVARPVVDWHGTCGNLLAGVAAYAVNHGLVRVDGPEAFVRIRLVNTDGRVEARVPVDRRGRARVAGDYAIDGVPGTGAEIDLAFIDPGGAPASSRLLPTTHAVDTLTVEGLGEVEATIVNAGNKAVFVRAEDIGALDEGFPGSEPSAQTVARLESIRAAAAVKLGLADSPQEATARTPAVPKVGVVAPARTYSTSSRLDVSAGAVDLTARLMSMQKPHPSYPVTGAIATAAAAAVPGSLIAQVCTSVLATEAPQLLRIGHPLGAMHVRVKTHPTDSIAYVESVEVGRTARVLVEGRAFPRGDQQAD